MRRHNHSAGEFPTLNMSKQCSRYVPYALRVQKKKVEDYKPQQAQKPPCGPNQTNGQDTYAELKAREILRMIYPLNHSGSKQIIVSLDPADDFHPVLTLGKPGWSGYRLSIDAFDVLVNSADHITEYFDNASDQTQSPIYLSASDMVEFRRNWGRNLICITNTLNNDMKVTIAKTTWLGLIDIFPLLTHVIGLYRHWQEDAMEVFVALSRRMKECLTPDDLSELPIVRDMDRFKSALKQISYDTLPYEGRQDTMLNLETCFLEMRAYCIEHIASFIPYV